MNHLYSSGSVLLLFLASAFMATTGFSSVYLLINSWKRYKFIPAICFAFLSIFLGSVFLILRFFYPLHWHVLLSLSICSYVLAMVFFYTHYNLSHHDFMEKWKNGFFYLLSSGILVYNQLLILIDAIDLQVAFIVHFIILAILNPVSLASPIIVDFREFRIYRKRRKLTEILGYLSLLVGAELLVIVFFTDSFDSPWYVLTLILGAGGATFLTFAYLTNPSNVFRLPYGFYVILGFHDSGMIFYQQQLLHLDSSAPETRSTLMGPYLTAIKSVFKTFLEQEMNEFIQKGKNIVMYMKRDSEKGLSFVIIAEKSSWYLKKLVSRLLSEIPSDLPIGIEGGPMDVSDVTQVISPIIKRLFPYFDLISDS